MVCHTAPGGQTNAGGLGLDTPFGTIFTTNITPDRETGIGAWSYKAFERAMREGIRALPPGTYRYAFDTDGGAEAVHIRAAVTIPGRRVRVGSPWAVILPNGASGARRWKRSETSCSRACVAY